MASGRSLLVVAVFFGMSLAGCIGSSAKGADASPAAAAGAVPAFNETTGSIQGIVTSPEIAPIASAQVGIAGTTLSALTDEGGHYALNYVPPGKVTVSVVALGFQSTSKQIDVVAGQVLQSQDFVLTPLPSLAPFMHTDVFKFQIGGELVKIGLQCTYGSDFGVHVPAGLPISDANVKTCQGGGFCVPQGPPCVGPQTMRYGQCGSTLANMSAYKTHGCDLDNDWQTIFGEIQWTPSSAITGRGWSWEVMAPNETRAGWDGSADQKDLHDWWQMNSKSPIKTRVDRATAMEGSPSGNKGNHPLKEGDLCGSYPGAMMPGKCDWVWRLFPGWCTIGGVTNGAAGCENPGPDFVADTQGTPVNVYFTYFERAPAPEGWTALPDQ